MKREDDDIIKKRYLGCIAGLVVGNGLGVPVEGWNRESIKKKYGVLKDFDLEISSGFGTGKDTDKFGAGENTDDDSEMALAIGESYIECGTCLVEDITRRFLRWFENDGRGIGISTRAVLSLIKSGLEPEEASGFYWEKNGRKLAGNGALMRCAPSALARMNNPDLLREETRAIGQITHYDWRSVDACIYLNFLIAELLKGEVPDLICCLSYIENEIVMETVKKAVGASRDELAVGGYVLDTLGVTVWIYKHFDNFEEGVIEAVNLGGDTDTSGAVVGAVLGAKYGFDAIPDRWINALGNMDRIKRVASGLYEIAWQL